MKKLFFIFCLVVAIQVSAQQVSVVNLSSLEDKISSTESTLTVFNFWATWCGPCIKEMPHFDNLESKFENLKVYFVSVDFKQDLQKVEAFAEKRSIKSEILFLDEKDPDYYMRKISQKWTGAIPATLFVTDLGKTYFHEQAFSKEELETIVKKYLN